MLLLWISAAQAGDLVVDATSWLPDVLAEAQDGDRVLIDEAYNPSTGEAVMVFHELTFEATGNAANLPPLYIAGVSVELIGDFSVVGEADFFLDPEFQDLYACSEGSETCGLVLDEAALTADHLDMGASDGEFGVYGYNSDLLVHELLFDKPGIRPVYMISDGGHEVELTDCELRNSPGPFWFEGYKLVTLDGCIFEANESSNTLPSDLLLNIVTQATLNEITLSESSAPSDAPILIEYTSLEITGGTYSSTDGASGLIYAAESSIEVSNAIVEETTGSVAAGAIDGVNTSVHIRESTFTNTSGQAGGLAHLLYGDLLIEDTRIDGANASLGGVISVSNATYAKLYRTRVCNASAEIGVVVDAAKTPVTLKNTVLHPAPGTHLQVDDAVVTLENNTLLSGEAGTLFTGSADVYAMNNIVAGYGDVHTGSGTGAETFNLFWQIAEGPETVHETSIEARPRFDLDFTAGDCTSEPYLRRRSPAIDAGNPELSDVDGTRSDMGALGGPEGSKYDYLEDEDTGDTEPPDDTGDTADSVPIDDTAVDSQPAPDDTETEIPNRWVTGGCSSAPAPTGIALAIVALLLHFRRRRGLAMLA